MCCMCSHKVFLGACKHYAKHQIAATPQGLGANRRNSSNGPRDGPPNNNRRRRRPERGARDMSEASRKVGDLQVWWIPQIPMPKAFEVDVSSVAEGVKLMTALADYDDYQLKHHIKPDYCNAGGLRRWCADSDGEGAPGWEDWHDDETGIDDPAEWLERTK